MRKILTRISLALAGLVLFASCTTAYDYHGRPQTVVTPEGAALGVAAAALVGYALADDDDYRHRGHHRHRGGYGGYYGGYGRYGRNCW